MRYSNTIKPVAAGSGASSSASIQPHSSYSATLPYWVNYGAVDTSNHTYLKSIPEPPNSSGVNRLHIYVGSVDNYADIYLDGTFLAKLSGGGITEYEQHYDQTLAYAWTSSSSFKADITNKPNGLLVSKGDQCNASNSGDSSQNPDPMCRNPMGISSIRLTFYYK